MFHGDQPIRPPIRTHRPLGTMEGHVDALGYIGEQDDLISVVSGVLATVERYLAAPEESRRTVVELDVRDMIGAIDAIRARTGWVVAHLRSGR